MWLALACAPAQVGLGPVAPDSDPDSEGSVPAGAILLSVEPPAGHLEGDLDVALTASLEGAEIRYTLDGTDPKDGVLYTGPFSVGDRTAAVHLRATAEGDGLTSDELSASYVVVPSVLSQPTEIGGFPSR
ncbi:MAG: hypothetical protein GY913_04475 [Proteobacteria bacterium]|nr:hypothetical protein [Pseudomonadota bacterium]MCP4916157.1 hypothetical protein [Pseudomonadota bacterium]